MNMREILFRGKSKDDHEWVYGYFVSQDKETYIFEQLEVDKGIDFGGYLDCCMMCEVVPETVGQFTGLNDKNGTKIFEGDIVDASKTEWEYWHDSPIMEIKWDEEFGGFDPFIDYDSDCGVYTEAHECVVVGNIHDNPELKGKCD